jgi:hypothetical protein
MSEFLTPAQIAGKVGLPLHRVVYVIRSRQIPEARRVGNIRLFDPAAVEAVLGGLQQISERRVGTGTAPALTAVA